MDQEGGTSFSAKLSELIKNWPYSQRRLSEATGLPQSAISEMVRGNRRPYLDQAKKIADVLEVPLDYLADDQSKFQPVQKTKDEEFIIKLIRSSGITIDQALDRLAGPLLLKAGRHYINKNDIVKITELNSSDNMISIHLRDFAEQIYASGEEASAILRSVSS